MKRRFTFDTKPKPEPTAKPEPPEFIDIEKAARIADVSTRTIRNWHSAKAISALKLNRVLRFHRATFIEELKAFVS